MIITGGGWAMLCSFAVSVLWHMADSWDVRVSDTEVAAVAMETDDTAAIILMSGPCAVFWWHAAAAGMFATIVRSWLVLLSHWGPAHAILSAVGAWVHAAVVLLAGALGPLLGALAARTTGAAGRLGWWCAQRA